jgi:long-subunit acyl-CoA synthetase (AMP-forming)
MSIVIKAIRDHARRAPDDLALMGADWRSSYADLVRHIDETSDWLKDDCSSLHPVAVDMANGPAWLVLDLALAQVGLTSVPLPPFFTLLQRQHALADCGAKWLISDAKSAKGDKSLKIGPFSLTMTALDPPKSTIPKGTAKITYTSGSTGTPKGVCLSQDGMEAVASSLVEVIGSDYAGTHFSILPLPVLLENVAGLYTALLAGGTWHIEPGSKIGFEHTFMPDFPQLARSLRDAKASSIILVPEILGGLLSALEAENVRLDDMRLVAVGGARVAPDLLRRAEACGLPVYQGYGLSEVASVVALNTPNDHDGETTGRVLPHVDLVIDENDEIIINNPAILGYTGSHSFTTPLRTGDLGSLDENGRLRITGRKANTIITGFGRNIAPEWVESELLAEPQIAQTLVYGETKPALGALIVPSGFDVDDAVLTAAIDRVNARLPAYARIKHWIKTMPFTSDNGLATGNGRPKRIQILKEYKKMTDQSYNTEGQSRSFFERLLHETAEEQQYLREIPQIGDAMKGDISLETYIAYLTEAYHHVKHTVPLMESAKAHMPKHRTDLLEALEEYIEEETGHEEWILNDIANAGGDAEAVRNGKPRFATEMMVSYAYDTIARINPAAFFGMVLVLEGTSTQLATSGAEAVQKNLGLDDNCFSYLTSHGALDLEHMKFFAKLMGEIDGPKDQEDILHMAKRMFVLFGNMFAGIPHKQEIKNAA